MNQSLLSEDVCDNQFLWADMGPLMAMGRGTDRLWDRLIRYAMRASDISG